MNVAKLKDVFDVVLIVFFFTGPLIGIPFFFLLYRWAGFWTAFAFNGAINLSWLCLVLYALSGLWAK